MSNAQIWLKFWHEVLHELRSPVPCCRYRSGRVFEYMWHYIFGEAPIIDPIPMCQLMHCPANATAPAAKPMAPSPKPKSAEYSTRQFTGRGIRRQPLRDMGIGSSKKA